MLFILKGFGFMNILKAFKALNGFEWGLWIVSVIIVSGSFLVSSPPDYLTLIASVIGVTALIFVAKGQVFGQFLIVIFSLFYGIISFYFKYYGEMITYVFMSAPMAVVAIITWLRHPFDEGAEVEVSKLTKIQRLFAWTATAAVTAFFYFILGALGNANLLTSTLSVATSFLAAYLTFCRSPYYAIGYAANDLVLIALWVMASVESLSYLPMVFCFIMFLVNDLYGFYNWRKMQKRQIFFKNNK